MEPVEEYQVILSEQARQLFDQVKDRREQQIMLILICLSAHLAYSNTMLESIQT